MTEDEFSPEHIRTSIPFADWRAMQRSIPHSTDDDRNASSILLDHPFLMPPRTFRTRLCWKVADWKERFSLAWRALKGEPLGSYEDY